MEKDDIVWGIGIGILSLAIFFGSLWQVNWTDPETDIKLFCASLDYPQIIRDYNHRRNVFEYKCFNGDELNNTLYNTSSELYKKYKEG